MSPNILPHRPGLPIEGEDARGVEPARLVEGRLMFAEGRGEPPHDIGGHHPGRSGRGVEHHRLDRGLAAQPAGARGEHVAAELLCVHGDAAGEAHTGAPARSQLDGGHLVRPQHDALGEQEAAHELLIVARGAHHDGERLVAEPDLEGRLDGHDVAVSRRGYAVRPPFDGDLGAAGLVARERGAIERCGHPASLLAGSSRPRQDHSARRCREGARAGPACRPSCCR